MLYPICAFYVQQNGALYQVSFKQEFEPITETEWFIPA